MLKNIRLLFVLSLLTFVFTNDVQIEIVEQNKEYVIISYVINQININEITYNNEIYHTRHTILI